MNALATGGLRPDLTLLLDLDPEAAFARAGEEDRFEAEGAELQRKVAAAYEELAAAEPERWRRIDADRAPEEVHADVLAAVQRRARRGAGVSPLGRDRGPPARADGAGVRAGGRALARLPLPRPRRRGQGRGGARVRRRAAGRGQRRSRRRPPPRAVGRPPRPDLGAADRRARDAARGRGRAGDRRRHPHAVRVLAARVRARARGHDERPGGQPDAQDAGGAGAVRAPDPAHRRARPGAAHRGVALPARALRPAARGADRGAAAGRGRGAERARGAARGWRWATATRARLLASEEGEALLADVDHDAGRAPWPAAGHDPWTGLLERARRARQGGGRAVWPPRARRGWRASPRAATAPRSSASSRRPPSARSAAAKREVLDLGLDPGGAGPARPDLPGRGRARGGAGPRPRGEAGRSAPTGATRAGCARPPSAARRCGCRSSST